MIGALLLLSQTALADELVVWHAYRGQEQEGLEQAVAAWAEAEGTQAKTVAIPFGAFDSKLETAIPRGNGPDLFVAGHGNLGKWRTMDLVEPVQIDLGEHTPATVAAVTEDGVHWGVPLTFKSVVLLYDPSVIETPPATTDELIALAKAHTGDGAYGLAYQASEPYFHAAWLHAFGGHTIRPDGTVTLDSEAQVAAYAFNRRLVDEGIVPQQPTGELVSRLYGEGKAAFVISGPWFVADLDRPIAAAPLPIVSETGQPAQPFLTVEAAFVASGADVPRATELAAFLGGPEGATIRQNVGRQAVTVRGVETDDPFLAVLAKQAENARPIPSDPRVQQVFEAQARALRKVLRGSATPEAAAREAQETFEVLSKPPPEPASPWPYVALMVLVGLAGLGWIGSDLRDPAMRRRIWEHRWDYIWVLPAAFAMVLLVVTPFVTGAGVAFFAHHEGEWTFVGIRHFIDILFARDWSLTHPLSFWFTLLVTVAWTVTNLILHVGIGVAMALVLREPWIRLRSMWRALLIIPWAVPNYITALIWKGMFHAQFGAVNALIGLVTFSEGPVEIDWFGNFFTSFAANLTTNTWLGFPFMMVVTLGALQSIPRDLEEAAEVDGAGFWFRLRHVIWPLLAPALLPAVILGSVWTFNMFNVIYLVSAGEPDSSTEILISEAYRWAFSRGNRYGYAAAYAVIIFFVLLAYSRGANRLVGRRVL